MGLVTRSMSVSHILAHAIICSWIFLPQIEQFMILSFSPRRIYTICNYGICKRQKNGREYETYSEKEELKRPSIFQFINPHPNRNPKILCSRYQDNHNIHLLILMKSAAPNSKLRIMNCSIWGRNIQEHNHLRNECLFLCIDGKRTWVRHVTNSVNRETVLGRCHCLTKVHFPWKQKNKRLIPYIYNIFK